MPTIKKTLPILLIGALALAGCAGTETPQADPVIPPPEAIEALFDLDGIYDDANGGTLTITNATEVSFAFAFTVVRGPTAHTGEIAGVAEIAGETATFVDTNEAAFINGNPCRLTFTLENGWITVTGEHTQYYHGARASFDGDYEKVE